MAGTVTPGADTSAQAGLGLLTVALLAPHTARRVEAALAAHAANRTVYLEDGYHPLPVCP
ncbi:MAG: hypothetical protein ACRDSP_10535 [Pseudonocardiaceae bacterium]